MPRSIESKPDSARDTKLENDLPRPKGVGGTAQIGDSITVTLSGDRIKVTLLGFIDPAEVHNPRMDSLLDVRGLADHDKVGDQRHYAGVLVKLRNLDSPISGRAEIVHVPLSGALVDLDDNKHCSSLTWVKGWNIAIPPQRGQPSSIGSVAFRVPAGSTLQSYVLGYAGDSYACFRLR